ncbi:MAG TPA: type II secretion system protein [Candidatus Eremiobacteraeota bacterium]|nr:type II secretion system protein [Candidatus Eremiobacteraeota bacterium]
MKTIYSQERGFSLLEIVIAIALLGMVIIVVCSVFAYGLQAIKKGQQNSAALNIANKKLDEISNIAMEDPNGILKIDLLMNVEGCDSAIINAEGTFIPWDSTGNQEINGSEKVGGVNYKFKIDIDNYEPDYLKKITVQVKWFDLVLKSEKTLQLTTLLARKNFDTIITK